MNKKQPLRSTGNTRVIQIHPSRLCNLSCLHCYSSSSPRERGALSAALLCNALTDMAAEGYDYLCISGGEPLLYKPLPDLLTHAKNLGLKTAIASNGMLLDEQHLTVLKNVVDTIAISLDGMPESHNRMRNSSLAFARMAANLDNLRKSGINFGFIFTLTQYNLNELDWVVRFALEQEAKLLQIHPLEESGFATGNLPEERPDRIESAYAYLLCETLKEQLKDQLYIQLDFASRQALTAYPDIVYAGDTLPETDAPLADCLDSLVIEPDGSVLPLQYGFSKHYSLGNLHSSDFKQLADDWRRERMSDFYALCRSVHQKVTTPGNPMIFNWDETLRTASHHKPAQHQAIAVGWQ
ncbi:MAG: radical SAM protein [Methylococcaceae bacterium]|nr:radical SAM protein [Methylococcaceae bacterium]